MLLRTKCVDDRALYRSGRFGQPFPPCPAIALGLCLILLLCSSAFAGCVDLLGSVVEDLTPRFATASEFRQFIDERQQYSPNRGHLVDVVVIRPGTTSAFQRMLSVENPPTGPQMREIGRQLKQAQKTLRQPVLITDDRQGIKQLLGAIAVSNAPVLMLIAHNDSGTVPLPNGEHITLARLAVAAAKAGKLLVLETCKAACYLDAPGLANEDVYVEQSVTLAAEFTNRLTKLAKTKAPIDKGRVFEVLASTRYDLDQTVLTKSIRAIADALSTVTRLLDDIWGPKITQVYAPVSIFVGSLSTAESSAQRSIIIPIRIALCRFVTLNSHRFSIVATYDQPFCKAD